LLGLGVAIVLLTALAGAHAEQDKACADFYDAAKGDRRAADVYVSVKQSEKEAACFLVPRLVIDRQVRLIYSDGDPYIFLLEFDPTDLFSYLVGKESVVVGTETRALGSNAFDCLTNPTPISIAVMPRLHLTPLTLKNVSVRAKQTVTDFTGYQRYSFSKTEDYYFADTRQDAFASFWCAVQAGVKVCNVIGEYDQMETGVLYPRSEMARVQPERAQRCVRAIAELFRVKSDKAH
jgi:hypothetical protein